MKTEVQVSQQRSSEDKGCEGGDVRKEGLLWPAVGGGRAYGGREMSWTCRKGTLSQAWPRAWDFTLENKARFTAACPKLRLRTESARGGDSTCLVLSCGLIMGCTW